MIERSEYNGMNADAAKKRIKELAPLVALKAVEDYLLGEGDLNAAMLKAASDLAAEKTNPGDDDAGNQITALIDRAKAARKEHDVGAS